MAAGFFSTQAIQSAKGELIERDAFLHHYQNLTPMKFSHIHELKSRNESKILVFQMETTDPSFSAFLVTDSECSKGQAECLLFGFGAHSNKKIALEKSIQEYSAILLQHQKRPERCRWLSENPEKIPTLMDRHNVAARDDRNKERFKSICELSRPQEHNVERPVIDPSKWIIHKFKTPISMFQYAQANHPELLKMKFGIPEPDSDSGDKPLFHPFW
jgi:hypothetical protein